MKTSNKIGLWLVGAAVAGLASVSQAAPSSCSQSTADAHQAAADRYLMEAGESLMSSCGIGGFLNNSSFGGGFGGGSSGQLGSCETAIIGAISDISGTDIPTSGGGMSTWGGFGDGSFNPSGGGGFPY